MLSLLPAPLLGFVVALLLVISTLITSVMILLMSPLKLLSIAFPLIGPRVRRAIAALQEAWTSANSGIFKLLPNLTWDIRGLAELSRDHWYFVVSNHQCWMDILAAFHVLNRRIPPLKIFIKQDLLYVPVIGLAVYTLDYPFMRRYSRELIAKKPHLRGKDLDTTRRACEKYKGYPVSVMSYLEGTRLTPSKMAISQSTYHYLLPPKSAGAAFVLNALGSQMDTVLDLTIAYPEGVPSFWDFCCGRVHRIVVDVTLHNIPRHFCQGSFENDPAFREEFAQWVQQIWTEKDQLLLTWQHVND
jgi:1-acyl-sn-glycerol-3-phosphate acyltransferase